jgi:DNA-directed RNA polymerase specialized sigma24 family protein
MRCLTHSEASEKLGTPLGTLKSRVKMAMDKLRDKLADLEVEA